MASALSPGKFPSQYQRVTLLSGLPDLLDDEDSLVVKKEEQILAKRLLSEINNYRPGLFERASNVGLDLTAKFKLFRIHLLKFLAILPSLDHDLKGGEVKKIFLETLRRLKSDSRRALQLKKSGEEGPLPWGILLVINIQAFFTSLMPARQLAWWIRVKIRLMARRFIAGETIDDARKSLLKLLASGRDATLDQLGELVVSEKEADNYFAEVIKLIEGLGQYFPSGKKNAAGINCAHVSIKVSALCSDFRPYAEEKIYQLIAPRLQKILLKACQHQVFINIDAEHYHYRDAIFKIYRKVLLSTPELKDFDQTGIVLQAYVRDAHQHFLEIVKLAQERNLAMPVRLVKGAYWDAETIEADAHSFTAPQFLNKEETDLHFRQLVRAVFENYPAVKLCLASHNYADHAFAEALKAKYFAHLPPVEHQCLHETYEALSCALVKMNWPVRNYIPIGGLLIGMAYLVRRVMENSSQVGILAMSRTQE